uniref:Uncharacterized protein n=1 Tax=Theropithecus gelada TaxID=9565 RepID=A0A8D2FH67_THEGE
MPLHSILGDRARLRLKEKKIKRNLPPVTERVSHMAASFLYKVKTMVSFPIFALLLSSSMGVALSRDRATALQPGATRARLCLKRKKKRSGGPHQKA